MPKVRSHQSPVRTMPPTPTSCTGVQRPRSTAPRFNGCFRAAASIALTMGLPPADVTADAAAWGCVAPPSQCLSRSEAASFGTLIEPTIELPLSTWNLVIVEPGVVGRV